MLCKALSLERSIGVFFHFYGTKDVNKGTWVSISVHPRKKLFPPYASNFKKDWQDSFARVQGAFGSSTSSVMVEGKPKFPLCWTSALIVVIGYDFNKMTPYEQGMVCFLEKLLLMDIHELLDREGDSKSLEACLREYFDLLYCLLFYPFVRL